MKKKTQGKIISEFLLGRRYFKLTNINEQARYMTMNSIFMVVIIPLAILGISLWGQDVRYIIDLGIAFMCVICVFLMRTKIPIRIIPIIPAALFGAYCVYLIYGGTLYWWTAVWIITFPMVAIFLCQMFVGIIQSAVILAGAIAVMYSPLGSEMPTAIRTRIIIAFILIMTLTIIYERISQLKDKKEKTLNDQLAHERDVIQSMKDNLQQGIFLMDADLKILPQYSKSLVSILSYYDTDLADRNFLDILSGSLDGKQLQTMKSYFTMVFSKSIRAKVLESANPISEFEYKIDDRVKILATKFNLIEQAEGVPVVIGIIEDITREKEFEKELQIQKEAQELEMKNMFDVIQIDPLVFQDFIEDMEANFNYINEILKDRTLTERQVITKFYQNIHAIKSNALVLGLENFGKKLHALEDEIKTISARDYVNVDDILHLAINLESLMQEKDNYTAIVRKIESFRSSNQLDSVFINSLNRAAEKISEETGKKTIIKIGHLDLGILESKLRKPIKDILFQCIRNTIYHGIETTEERIRKNKRPEGLITLTIKKIDNRAEIVYSDDGQGLDWEKIKAKYLEKNPGASDFSKKVLLSSIFTPEFSTAAETSTIAGRGVGLSLVRDLVKENRGTIQVDSSSSGLTFKFIFPM